MIKVPKTYFRNLDVRANSMRSLGATIFVAVGEEWKTFEYPKGTLSLLPYLIEGFATGSDFFVGKLRETIESDSDSRMFWTKRNLLGTPEEEPFFIRALNRYRIDKLVELKDCEPAITDATLILPGESYQEARAMLGLESSFSFNRRMRKFRNL
ncbi:MAG: hypothetical protein AABW80_00890 [Nanoarchaeota archaeon]